MRSSRLLITAKLILELLRSLALPVGGVLIAPSFLIADEISAGTLTQLLRARQLLAEFAINAIYPHFGIGGVRQLRRGVRVICSSMRAIISDPTFLL